MASFNKVILAGNLTRDPEYRVTPNGAQICNIGIAVNRKFTTQSGEQRDDTTFVDAVAWGKTGETISKHFSKGKPILIEGRLKTESWQTQQGENRSKLVIDIQSFSFIESRDSSGSNNQNQGGYQPRGSTQSPPQPGAPAQGQPAPFNQAPPAPTPQSTAPAPQSPPGGQYHPDNDQDEDVPF